MKFGDLESVSAIERLDLLATSTCEMVKKLNNTDIQVAAIDANLADTATFCSRYNIGLDHSANCVIVEATRAGEIWLAACVLLASTKADINGILRRHLGARRVSFAPMEKALAETKMEYGGITPLGLPEKWQILIDSRVIATDWIVLGSGTRRAKLIVPGSLLLQLPNAKILENLAR